MTTTLNHAALVARHRDLHERLRATDVDDGRRWQLEQHLRDADRCLVASLKRGRSPELRELAEQDGLRNARAFLDVVEEAIGGPV